MLTFFLALCLMGCAYNIAAFGEPSKDREERLRESLKGSQFEDFLRSLGGEAELYSLEDEARSAEDKDRKKEQKDAARRAEIAQRVAAARLKQERDEAVRLKIEELLKTKEESIMKDAQIFLSLLTEFYEPDDLLAKEDYKQEILRCVENLRLLSLKISLLKDGELYGPFKEINDAAIKADMKLCDELKKRHPRNKKLQAHRNIAENILLNGFPENLLILRGT